MDKPAWKILILAVVFALTAAGTTPLVFSQTGFEVISIPPTALKPADYAGNNLPWISAPDAFYFANGSSASIDATAYVPLPNLPGTARIMGLTVYCLDNACGVEQKLVVSLTRHDLETGQILVLAEVTTDGLPCLPGRRTLEDASVESAVIDNARYSYALAVKFFAGTDQLRFLGAKISFQGFKLPFD